MHGQTEREREKEVQDLLEILQPNFLHILLVKTNHRSAKFKGVKTTLDFFLGEVAKSHGRAVGTGLGGGEVENL